MATEPHLFGIRAFVADAAEGGRIALDALASVVAPLGVVTRRTAEPYWKIASLTELNVEVLMPSFDRAAVHAALALPGGTFAWVTAFPQSDCVA